MGAKELIESQKGGTDVKKQKDVELPIEISQPVIDSSKEKTKELKLSVEEKIIFDKLKDNKISYLKFLEFSKDKRLKYCTRNNIDIKDVETGKIKDITFDFKFGGKKVNKNIYLGTTAGQLLPEEVAEVKLKGKTYRRSGLLGEFFNDSNKRLIIHQGTGLHISKLLGKEEKELQKEENSKNADRFLDAHNTYKKETNQEKKILLIQIVDEAQKRNIDMDFAIKICMPFLKEININNNYAVAAKIENILTEVSRVRGAKRVENIMKSPSAKIMLLDNLFGLDRLFTGKKLSERAITFGVKIEEIEEYKKSFQKVHSDTRDDISLEKMGSIDFNKKFNDVCNKLQVNPNHLKTVIWAESKFDPKAQNKQTKATGLIQFMPATARGLGTSVDKLKKMSGVEQLDYVYKFYKRHTGKLGSVEQLYLATFYPVGLNHRNDINWVLGSEKSMSRAKKVYNQNAPIKKHCSNGYITVGSFYKYVRYQNKLI